MRPITANDLMTPVVLTVREEWTVGELATFLGQHEIHGAPVVNEAGRLVGVVSVVDIAAAASREGGRERASGANFFRVWEANLSQAELEELRDHREDLRVRDIMTPEIHAVPESATVHEVASLMLNRRCHRLLVTREEQVVGVVSTSDLLGLLLEERV